LSYGKKLIVAANLGLQFRKPVYLQDVKWGNAALWRVGLHAPVHRILWFSTELDASHQFGEQRGVGSNPVEGLISSRLLPWRSLVATLGGGTGLSRGIGAPAYRFFLGIGWLPKATQAGPKRDSPRRPAGHAEQPARDTNARIQVTDNQILIREKIFFDVGSAQIGAESHGLLDELVVVVLDHPELTLIEVQGHTDDQGEVSGNQALSQARAEAVMLYMVRHSVDARRVIARGFGETRPLDTEDTDAARATNRRVELHIMERQ
jgi:outer membrane protein OmpA-like peptidoglycan-associated protein